MRRSLLLACLFLVGLASVGHTAFLRGVVEGYYGVPWSGPARRDVIAFLGAHRLNAFVYAPKNDDFHRARWRDPYPAAVLDDLAVTAKAARAAHVHFIYALSPVLDICYACAADFRALTAKLRQLRRARVRQFALLFDDGGTIRDPVDIARYGGTDARALAYAQADLTLRVRRWSRAHHLHRRLLMVPSDYAGVDCHPYHIELARRLPPDVPIGWTGPGVFASTITAAQARARADCLAGRPVVLWDNYPVNDTVLSINLHLGPLSGRAADLPAALYAHLFNPMTQAHASLVALGTAAEYFAAPATYDQEAAWQRILGELGGDGFATLAAQTRSSALDLDDARALAALIEQVATSYATPEWPAAVDGLEVEELQQAAAPQDITTRLGASPLASEIDPWVQELAAHARRGLEAVTLLRAMKPHIDGLHVTSDSGQLTVTGVALGPDPTQAQALGASFAAEAVLAAARIMHPPSADFVSCLGNLLGADIHFCSAFGLNVHGKALYFLLASAAGTSVITDRNVHLRLITHVASAYGSWLGRSGPTATDVQVRLDDVDVPIAGSGAFTVSAAANVSHRLLLTTTAGDATAVPLP